MDEPLITFVLPFYNEERYLGRTLECLARQNDRRFSLRLVDNASTDRSASIAEAWARSVDDIPVELLHVQRPGKIFALQGGAKGVSTAYIGTLDADTIYPPSYVSGLLELFSNRVELSAVLALPAGDKGPEAKASLAKRLQVRLLPNHCHTGGYGQAFSRVAFEKAGGFDPVRWPYVLEDHEIVHAVSRHGPIGYLREQTVVTDSRRDDRSGCSWSLLERTVYKLLPASAGLWYFHKVLAPRFAARGLANIALRSQQWNQAAN